jgi:hypothetical protein
MADWTELEPMDQVSFWIGRVSRGDTTMEAQLHAAYEQLAGPSEGLGWAAVPRMMAGKLQGLRAMLKESDQSEDEIRECLRALKQIEKAHEERNSLVHGHWGIDFNDPASFSRTKAGLRGGPPTVTWKIEEFERLWMTMAEGTQVAGALYKTFLRWSGSSLGEHWDLQTREELAGRFTLSNINDSGGGFGSFIHFTPEVETRMRQLTIEEDAKRFPGMRIHYPWDDENEADPNSAG